MNDPGVGPDTHGQAALLLAESILHALVESGTLSAAEAQSAVQSAAEVKIEMALDAGEPRDRMLESLALLAVIGQSFAVDTLGT